MTGKPTDALQPALADNRPAPEWDLQEARRILLTLLAPYDCDVYLFGSRAEGTMRRFSDIDIAIAPHQELPFDLISELRDELEQSHIIYHVDLVDLSQTSVKFRQKVEQGGVQWNA